MVSNHSLFPISRSVTNGTPQSIKDLVKIHEAGSLSPSCAEQKSEGWSLISGPFGSFWSDVVIVVVEAILRKFFWTVYSTRHTENKRKVN